MQKVLPDHVPQVIYVGGEWIAWIIRILKLWNGLVSTPNWILERGTVLRVVTTRDAKISEIIFGRTLRACVMFGSAAIVAFHIRISRMIWHWIHGCCVHHDIQIHAVTVEFQRNRLAGDEVIYTDVRRGVCA